MFNVRKTLAAALALLFLAWSAAHAERYAIPLFPAPGASGDPQGVLRIVNDTGEAATVQVYAIADDGTRSGPATVALGASAAVQFDAAELRSADAARGLSGGLGSVSGDVRLTIDSDAPIVPLAFVRGSDGTLSAMHDTVRPALAAGAPYRYEIPLFNASTESAQASRLRLINPGDASAAVTVGGRDDSGAAASGGNVTLAVPAGGARTLTAQQLEAGGAGVTGRLGAGSGKWRLTVESDRPLQVVNVAVSAAGSWNNLSTTAAGAAPVDERGFAERFAGERVVFESRAFTAATEFFADGRFAETLEYFGFVWQAGGRYDYVMTAPDAGRVTADRDDGDDCGVDMYFGSPSGGRFATHCAGGGADDLWFGGRWFVGDGGAGTAFGVRDELPGVPASGAFEPAHVMGGAVSSTAEGTRIDLEAGGYFELADGTRYTCAASGGCVIENGTVTRGAVTGRAVAGGDVDRFPSFRAAAGPGDRDYAVGAAIDALTLPEAAGGNPPLTYGLSPEVPGLSFDAATRRLTGTPTAAASYAMVYTVTDADGDTDSLRFTIEVRDAESTLSAPEVGVSDTEITVSFSISGPAGGPVAFDAALRFVPTEYRGISLPGGCQQGTFDPGVSEATFVWTIPLDNPLPAGTVVEARYRQYDGGSCSGAPGPWSPFAGATAPGQGLGFIENGPVVRTIPENLPGGINVGVPVTAVGGNPFTYGLGGVDAGSFDIVPETGQLRTREDVRYDFETKSRYEIEITIADDAGNRETKNVVIDVSDLEPNCNSAEDLGVRTNSGDGRITARWKALPDIAGRARVLGYQIEIKRGSTGPWTDRRTFYGQAIAAATYANLDDGIEYHVRVRAVSAEGDCPWSIPVSGIPTGDFAPRDIGEMFDRFGPHPVGTDERNLRLLAPGRCRHTANGVSLDAHCRYERTSPRAGRITLEFDDPSRGSCDATFAYSSLTAGSFLDECFDAGVNTNVPFDRSFRMPPLAPRTEDDPDPPPAEIEPQRAPRNQKEFDDLVFGRADFIPGLAFGRFCMVACARELTIRRGTGLATRFSYSPDSGWKESLGTYAYTNTGPSTGVVTHTVGSEVYSFELDFEPVGNVRVKITGPGGEVTEWPGMLHLDLTLGAQPIFLPIPPSWSAAIAIEAEAIANEAELARETERREEISRALRDRFLPEFTEEMNPLIFSREGGRKGGLNFSGPNVEIQQHDNRTRVSRPGSVDDPGFGAGRLEAVGRNRFVYVFAFPRRDPKDVYGETEEETDRLLELNGSEWTFVVTIKPGGGAEYSVTVTKEGELPVVGQGFLDPDGGSLDLDEFPDELRLPDESPQAAGTDVAGVEVAAANSAPEIGPDDLQVLLVSADGGDYQPGDWLEPKDGGNQRMMIVSAGQSGSVAASNRPLRFRSLIGAAAAAPAPQFHARSGGIAGDFKSSVGLAPYTLSGTGMNPAVQPGAVVPAAAEAEYLPLIVVCMQQDRDIPTRGARYFSAAKSADGPVQTCQKECVLNESANIQRCVWACEREGG